MYNVIFVNILVANKDFVLCQTSLSDPGNSNLIPFPGAKCLSLSEGKLYVGTARSLYRFIPISVDEQVEVNHEVLGLHKTSVYRTRDITSMNNSTFRRCYQQTKLTKHSLFWKWLILKLIERKICLEKFTNELYFTVWPNLNLVFARLAVILNSNRTHYNMRPQYSMSSI